MSKIPGKLKQEDLAQLLELVTDKTVLQLGCYCGRGLIAVARHAKRVWVLDDFQYSGGMEAILEELKSNISRCVPEEARIDLLYGTPDRWGTPSGAEELQPAEVEVIYRDANRPFASEAEDQRLAMGILLSKGGTYAWHDGNYDLRWLVVEPVPVEVN